MQSIDSIETNTCETSKDLLSDNEEIKCVTIKENNTTMITFDDVTKENIKEHNPNWPQFSDHPYRILIVWGLDLEKKNSLFNQINQQPGIDKIYLYAKDPYKANIIFLLTNKKVQA